jgi:hypothetical protein
VPGAVLYQHKRIIGSGRSQQVYTYLVLHLLLARPVIDQLQIWPRSYSSDLGRLFGHLGGSGEEVDLESTELMQYYHVSGLPGKADEVTRLLAPGAIVKLLNFHRGLSDANAYFEIQGTAAAFLVEKALSPKRPELIEELLELWKPLTDWLFEESGEPLS